MRRMLLFALGLIVLGQSGCSTDPREPIVEEMVRQIDIAGTKLKGIREKVENAVSQAKKKAEQEKREVKSADLKSDELKTALEAVKGLKEVGAALVTLNRQIQGISDPVTPDEQARYADTFAKRLQSEMVDLDREDDKLNHALAEAERINPDAVRDLRDKLSEASADFESVAKRS